ncbi:hypothetical protein ACFL35_11430 [Candidatus Riflebacteria bacterium]
MLKLQILLTTFLFLPAGVFALPEASLDVPERVYEKVWASLAYDIFFEDNFRIRGLDIIPSGTTQLGTIKTISQKKTRNNKNHLKIVVPFKSSDSSLLFKGIKLMYHVGTGTETIYKNLSLPEVKIGKWIVPAFSIIFCLFSLVVFLLFYGKKNRTRKNRTDSSHKLQEEEILTEEDKTFLARQLTEENFTGFFRRISELEKKSGLKFSLEESRRERILYAGEKDRVRELPKLLGKYVKQFEVEEEENYE